MKFLIEVWLILRTLSKNVWTFPPSVFLQWNLIQICIKMIWSFLKYQSYTSTLTYFAYVHSLMYILCISSYSNSSYTAEAIVFKMLNGDKDHVGEYTIYYGVKVFSQDPTGSQSCNVIFGCSIWHTNKCVRCLSIYCKCQLLSSLLRYFNECINTWF